MVAFLSCVASNALCAACLAVVATVLTRAWRNPHLAHALWLLVLIKLVTPPIVHVPVDQLVWSTNTQSEWASATELAPLREPPAEGVPAIVTYPETPQITRSEDIAGRFSEMKMWDVMVTSWPQWVLAVWILGTVAFISIGMRRHLRLLRLIADSQTPDDVIARDAAQLARQVGLAACPPVRVIAAHVGPFVTPGVITPTVVLPRQLLAELNGSQIKSMLAHELAHIRRRDHWIRIFEVCVLSLNWWNPVAWWASRELRLAEEQCCDAWVVWGLPDMRRAYGQTLLRTVDYLTGENVLAMPAGTSFLGCQLERRIEMIMNRTVNRRMSPAACVFTLALGTIVLPVGIALSQSVGPPEASQDADNGQASHNAMTPDLVAKSYENYLNSIRGIAFHSDFKDRNADKSDTYTNGLSQDWWIDFEGKRLRRITKRLDPDTGKTVNGLNAVLDETLLTPDTHYQITADPDTGTAKVVLGYLHVPDNYWRTDLGLLYLSYPFGYFVDGRQYQYIPDAFQNMSVGEDGSSLVVLLCKTKEYELEMRLDRSKGWMPNRIKYSRTVPNEDPSRPNYFLYTVDHASSHDGIWIPDSFRCESSRPEGKMKLPPHVRMVDGVVRMFEREADEGVGVDFIEKEKSTLIAEIALSNIRVAVPTDSSFQLQTTIPNGLQVHMQDARRSGFRWFRWVDGKVVPEN